MNNKEVLNLLSQLEEFFLYKRWNAQELIDHQRILNLLHDEAKTMLIQWSNITGEKID